MSVVTGRATWLRDLTRATAGAMRLFCVPHAGAGSLAFRRWPASLGPDVKVTAVQLPGREERIRESGYERLDLLVNDLVSVLAGALDQPYAFFGHSMGSLVVYEATRRIRERALPPPAWLFCSGLAAPHLAGRDSKISELSDDEFQHAITRLNGFPADIAEKDHLMEMLLPGLRRDFRLYEDYVYIPGPPLDVPLTVFGGTEDGVARADLDRWRELSVGPFRLSMVPGDHYTMTQREELAQAVRSDLSRLADG